MSEFERSRSPRFEAQDFSTEITSTMCWEDLLLQHMVKPRRASSLCYSETPAFYIIIPVHYLQQNSDQVLCQIYEMKQNLFRLKSMMMIGRPKPVFSLYPVFQVRSNVLTPDLSRCHPLYAGTKCKLFAQFTYACMARLLCSAFAKGKSVRK
jgi:hypothetical protein